jgi:myxalamid-type polyketide synthase MxaC
MFEKGMIPPHLNLQTLNSRIHLEGTRIDIPRQAEPWPAESARMAGVSSFGFGGTNCHLVIGPPPARVSTASADKGLEVLTLSAASHGALLELANRYIDFLAGTSDRFRDICHTANTGRTRFTHRVAILSATAADAAWQLRHFIDAEPCEGLASGIAFKKGPDVHISCRGTEEELARELLHALPGLRTFHHGIKRLLGPDQNCPRAIAFASEYALLQTWQQFGVTSASFSGKGMGGFLADCASGRRSILEAVHGGIVRGRASLPERGPADGAGSRGPILEISADCSLRDFLSIAARLFVAGVELNWVEIYRGHDSARVRSPTYPFQREQYWIADRHD